MKLISPSLLSADFGNLQHDIEMLNESECDWLHVDVMDGVFVPNISFGQPVVKHIKKHARKPLDVHLMIVDPGRYVNDFKEAGADILTVHYEACTHLDRTLHAIKDAGCGWVIEPENARLLSEMMKTVAALDSANLKGYGEMALKYGLEHFSKRENLRKLTEVIESVVQ